MAQNTLTYTFHYWGLLSVFFPVPIYFLSFELQILIESNLNPQNLPVQFAGSKFLCHPIIVFTSTHLFLWHAFDFIFIVCIGMPIIYLYYYYGLSIFISSSWHYILLVIIIIVRLKYILTSYIYIYIGRVWRYQRGNQNTHIEEEQTTQWPKEKSTKGQTTIYIAYI